MRKVQMVTLMSVCVLSLAACGSNAAVTVEEESSAVATSVAESSPDATEVAESIFQEYVENASEEEVPAAAPASAVGKRSNPVGNGQTASFDLTYYDDSYNGIPGNASITLSNPVRGQAAFDTLMGYNQFNSPAPEGLEWLIFDVNVTLNEGSPDYAFNSGSIYFKVIGSDGSQVDQNAYGVLDDNFGGNDLYVGGTDWGQEAVLVPIGDTGVLIEANGFSTPSVFFNLN